MNLLTLFAVTAAIFVNGATDAPGNVAGAVSSGSISYRRACLICAVFNFIGMSASSLLFPAVAERTASLIPSGDGAVAASLTSVILFSCAAWLFGIPTSESHGLMAALGGAAVYYGGSPREGFGSIITASALSCLCGFAVGYASHRLLGEMFSVRLQKRKAATLQGTCAALESLCHGIQDGQKFIALLWSVGTSAVSSSAVLLCSAVMALGCLAGGKRISDRLSDTVGRGSVGEAICADLSGAAVTLSSSVLGIPVSTTYMKSCAMMGSSLSRGRAPSKKNVFSLAITWLITYPVCMTGSYCLCHLWESLF